MKRLEEFYNSNCTGITGKWFGDKLNCEKIERIPLDVLKGITSTKYRKVFHDKQKHNRTRNVHRNNTSA